MNELQLATDLPTITAEINAYKRVAGEAIFEIGRRLKHVKETKLAESRGGWTSWLREVELDDSQARRFIKVVSEFSEEDRGTYHALGLRALYEIATLPLEERERPHTIPSTGATKTVDEMTVRELREVKAALKAERGAREAAERRADKAESDYRWNGRPVINAVRDRSPAGTWQNTRYTVLPISQLAIFQSEPEALDTG